jgi:hypothetical protein
MVPSFQPKAAISHNENRDRWSHRAHLCSEPSRRVERRVRRSSKSDLSAEARRAKEEGGSDTHQLLTMKVSLALHADLPPLQIKFLHWAAANQPDGQITSDYQK